MEDAAELTGLSRMYLRRLMRLGELAYRGSRSEPFFAWSDVRRLIDEARPFWCFDPDPKRPPSDYLLDGALADVVPNGRGPRRAKPPAEGTVEAAHCLDWLRRLNPASVQSFVSSPPYWGQRRYPDEHDVAWLDGETCAYGREKTPEGYIRHTLEVLRHIKRALKDDGTIWLVIGDTYVTRTVMRSSSVERWQNYTDKQKRSRWSDSPDRRYSSKHPYLKDKDLSLVPFMVAQGAQRIGLYCRSVIIWSKQKTEAELTPDEQVRSHMPEPTSDRPTLGHEYVLLLSKARRYYYDATEGQPIERRANGDYPVNGVHPVRHRTVWSFPTATNYQGHYATFPIELARRCVRLSTRPGDLVADCFAGSGTTLIAAKELGRQYMGCDFSPTYVGEARRRLESVRAGTPPAAPDGVAEEDPAQTSFDALIVPR
jgi:DNA modification methylase